MGSQRVGHNWVTFTSFTSLLVFKSGGRISRTLGELLLGGEARSQVIQKFWNKGQVVWRSKVLLWIKENQAMAPHSSTLAWKIPWMEEPGGLQSMGSLRVGHNWATSLSLFTFLHWKGNGNLLQCSCLENPRDGGAWWAAVYGIAQSRAWLKWLSSSSSNKHPKFRNLTLFSV